MGEESIYNSIVSLLGSDADYTPYQGDFIVLINSALARLNQLGAGPSEVFQITGPSETWDQFSSDKYVQAQARMFAYYTLKLSWDPPSAGFVLESFKELRKETEWLLEAHCSSNN